MNPETIYIRSAYEKIRIDLNDIEYIESFENYVKIHFTRDKPIMSLIPLKKILEKIPPEKFVQIHRRYIVAIDKIKRIGTKKVTINGVELPGGGRYFKSLKSRLIDY